MADMEDQTIKKGGMNPIVTGAAGVVIGAGVAVAASRMMTDKKTRDKVFHTISGIRKQASDSLEKVAEKARELTASTDKKVK